MKQFGRFSCAALIALAAIAVLGATSASASFQAGAVGSAFDGSPTGSVVFSVQGTKLECDAEMLGEVEGTEENTQDLHPALECHASGFGTFYSHAEGCAFRLDPNEEATLHSCKSGGIEMNLDNASVHCHVFIPNQTVPVSYTNGSEESPFAVSFDKSTFDGEVTESRQGCWLTKTEETTVQMTGNYEVVAAGGFWFDPEKTLPSEFHTAASSSIEGTPAEGVTSFTIDNSEQMECEIGDLAGEFPAAESSKGLGELAVDPATGSCTSSYWGGGASIDETGCSYEFGSAGTAGLTSCANGGIVLSVKVPFIARCKVFVPDQSGAAEVTYRNHGVNGDVGVQATQNLALSGEVTESHGSCPYAFGEEVSVSQQGTVQLVADEGATELWFG